MYPWSGIGEGQGHDQIRYIEKVTGKEVQPAALGLDLGAGPEPQHCFGAGAQRNGVWWLALRSDCWVSGYERERLGAKELFVCSRTGSQFSYDLKNLGCLRPSCVQM